MAKRDNKWQVVQKDGPGPLPADWVAHVNEVETAAEVEALRRSGAPASGLLSVPMARMPELTRAGGSVLLHADASDFLGRRVSVLVANTTSEGLRAYGAYCPHAGCEVAWVDGENSVVCPCHLSQFAVDGSVTHPPAVETSTPIPPS